MDNIKITSGARIGDRNVTWPFAKLLVSPGKLELNASMIGNLVFRPGDIIALEPYYSISSGIRIRHRVAAYEREVIFWCEDPPVFLRQIYNSGFLDPARSSPAEQTQEILEKQISGGAPFKKSVMIVFGIVWNLLLLSDFALFALSDHKGSPLGYGAFIALLSCLILSIVLFVSEPVRKLVLKNGRALRDISRLLVLIMVVSGFTLMIMSLIWISGK